MATNRLTKTQQKRASATTYATPATIISGRLLTASDNGDYEAGTEFAHLEVQRMRMDDRVMVFGGGYYNTFATLAEFDAVIACTPADHQKVMVVFDTRIIWKS